MKSSGISLADFTKIIGEIINYYPEITGIQINPPVISGTITIKSEEYDFLIDFDDNGVITGNYTYQSSDKVLNYVLNFADDIQDEVDYLVMNGEFSKRERKVYIYQDEADYKAVSRLACKCPNCGSDIGANSIKCCFCGYELATRALADSVARFIAKLEQCDVLIASGVPVSPGFWGNKSKKPKLSNEEKNKRDIIVNYQIPNERNAIMDAMTLIYGKMKKLLDNKFRDMKAVFWFNVWKDKAQELKKQQESICFNDNEINGIFHEIEELVKIVEHRR